MRRIKSQKGITLIALIITIIVLLILAVVAIGAVQNDGIINHAKNAKEEYGKAQVNENETLGNYLEKLNENYGSLEGEDNTGKTKITFSVSSAANYGMDNDYGQFETTSGTTWKDWIEKTGYESGEINFLDDGKMFFSNLGCLCQPDTSEFGVKYTLWSDEIQPRC